MAPAAASTGMAHEPSDTSQPPLTRSSSRMANIPSSSVSATWAEGTRIPTEGASSA